MRIVGEEDRPQWTIDLTKQLQEEWARELEKKESRKAIHPVVTNRVTKNGVCIVLNKPA